MALLKQIAAQLPHRWQTELKRSHYRREIQKHRFVSREPDFGLLHDWVKPGDWVIDIGANIGYYTKRFSELVGPRGRVIAFEPVPTTFSLLAANTLLFAHQNVTLINAAVSDKLCAVGMSVAKASTGLDNYHEAHLSRIEDSAVSVLAITVDSLAIDHRIAVVKVDTEGHEASVLAGMRKLIEASRPVLIVETGAKEIIADLTAMGYSHEILAQSPNSLFKPRDR